jgi:hypothetical protein
VDGAGCEPEISGDESSREAHDAKAFETRRSLFGKNIIAADFLYRSDDPTVRDGGARCPPLEPGDIPRIR